MLILRNRCQVRAFVLLDLRVGLLRTDQLTHGLRVPGARKDAHVIIVVFELDPERRDAMALHDIALVKDFLID